MREVVNKLTPGFMKPFVNKVVPISMLPQMSTTIGLGSWLAVGGCFAFFMIQDPAFKFVKDTVNPPPEADDK